MRKPSSIEISTCALLGLLALSPVPVLSAMPCRALAQLSLENVVGLSAQETPAGPFSVPVSGPTSSYVAWGLSVEGDLPAFCRVSVIVRPQITLEVWLPKDDWNQRFLAIGGAGHAGYISYRAMADALRAGYATASTDTGHHHSARGAFGLNPNGSLNAQLIEDFAWRSLQELALKSKALIKAHYGEPPRYSYWRGGSTGGRQGLAAVQRFPEAYDGVLAGAPAIHWENYLLSVVMWQYVVVRQEVGHPIEQAKLIAVNKAAVAACDGEDGVRDGLISDPRQCRFDPGGLVCKSGKNQQTCLTAQEANAIRKIWQGPRTRAGERLWFGIERGTDFWWASKLEPGPDDLEHLLWTKQNPHFDWRTLKEEDFEELLRESSRKFREVIGTDRTDLERFRARGGKLLIWHGENDELIPPRGIMRYFDQVFAAHGGAAQVNSFARLFLLAGVGHGGRGGPFPGGAALDSDAMFDALVEWVEKGIEPDHIIASEGLPDGRVRTRPLCTYPKIARWTDKGSADEAANFECVNGAHYPNDFRVEQWHRP